MTVRRPEFDVAIIGGGPAGATLGALLAMDGRRVAVLERDIHPRDHVGESLTPSNNAIFSRIGFLPRMEQAGFVHKEGVGWTAPRSPVWKFLAIRTSDFPAPGAVQTYSYNVERDEFDLLLLRHAHELGAKVVQGATVKRVLFEGDRAIGVRVELSGGWEEDVLARVVVDASGRRCFLANQLGIRRKDPDFNQFSIFSWFRGVKPHPPGYEGFVFFHFLGLERAWGWHIPIKDGVCSMGVVTDKADFGKSGKTHDEFFETLVQRNRTFRAVMEDAVRIKPWWIEGDYSYQMDTIVGDGWLMIGDAFRFVDPIFSSGIDVATYSASYAFDAIVKSWSEGEDTAAFAEYERTVNEGVDVWYETTDQFYRLQQLFSRFSLDRRYKEDIARALQGNPYNPQNRDRARRVLKDMRDAYRDVMADPHNLLRPGALDLPAQAQA
ncbi:hypothetical protein BH20ACT24_BH20ACT24_08710 [soil metagenome]